jgi:hypothetical protein
MNKPTDKDNNPKSRLHPHQQFKRLETIQTLKKKRKKGQIYDVSRCERNRESGKEYTRWQTTITLDYMASSTSLRPPV